MKSRSCVPLGIAPPLTTRREEIHASQNFMICLAVCLQQHTPSSTHGRLSLSLRELEFCTWMESSMSVVSLASKRIYLFAWCVKQLKGACWRTDFRWWSRTTLQVEENRRLLSAWNFLGYSLARSCGVVLHGFFFGFTFWSKIIHFQSEIKGLYESTHSGKLAT